MLLHHTSLGVQNRLNIARRIFSLLPFIVFVLTIMLLASYEQTPYAGILHVVLQAAATSLASSFVSIAAYGFYRYLIERSPGL
jgi:hypothetical protein